MELKLDIPFLENPGWECGQVCSAMMLKYFKPESTLDLKTFDQIIHHQGAKKYTYPLQNAILLDSLGIKCMCYSKDDYVTTKEDPDIFKKSFGKDFSSEINFIDETAYNWMVEEGLKRGLFEKRNTSLDDIIGFLVTGHVPAIAIDWNTLKHKEGIYEGHFVIISGVSGDNILVHDPDAGPFISYPKADIEKAYMHPVIADDCWVSFGVK